MMILAISLLYSAYIQGGRCCQYVSHKTWDDQFALPVGSCFQRSSESGAIYSMKLECEAVSGGYQINRRGWFNSTCEGSSILDDVFADASDLGQDFVYSCEGEPCPLVTMDYYENVDAPDACANSGVLAHLMDVPGEQCIFVNYSNQDVRSMRFSCEADGSGRLVRYSDSECNNVYHEMTDGCTNWWESPSEVSSFYYEFSCDSSTDGTERDELYIDIGRRRRNKKRYLCDPLTNSAVLAPSAEAPQGLVLTFGIKDLVIAVLCVFNVVLLVAVYRASPKGYSAPKYELA